MKLIKVARGQYQTEDGRYVVWALSGWYRGYWELVDTLTKAKTTHDGKRAAVAALTREAGR